MNSRLIRERWYESTKPFFFRLSDGTRVTVMHPDFMAMGAGQIIVMEKSGRVHRIDPLHVVAMEDAPPGKSRSKANGKRPR